jgi:hypothetical protein
MAAVAVTLRTTGAPITDDFTDTLALLQARLGALAEEVSLPQGIL